MNRAFLLGVLLAVPALAQQRGWSLNVDKLSYSGGRLELTLSVPCEGHSLIDPVYVGLTLKKARDATAFDAPAKVVAAKDLCKPITYAEQVGPGFVRYTVAIWKSKKEGCGEGVANGCHDYGYYLDDLLASWPKGSLAYRDEMQFDGIGLYRIQVLKAGGDYYRMKVRADDWRARKLGSRSELVDGPDQPERQGVEIRYKTDADKANAESLEAALRKLGHKTVELKAWPEAPYPLVVAAGKD